MGAMGNKPGMKKYKEGVSGSKRVWWDSQTNAPFQTFAILQQLKKRHPLKQAKNTQWIKAGKEYKEGVSDS